MKDDTGPTGQREHHRAAGLVPVALMTLANVIFAFNDVWLRRIADDIGLVQTIWGRSVLFLCLVLFTMNAADRRLALAAPKPHLQIVRGVFPVMGAFLMIGAMAHIPVADATATFFMSPVIAVMLAIPFLGERVGPAKWIALALGIAGMLVIARPGTSAFHWAHLWALAAALVVACYQIFTSFVTRHSNVKTTLLYMAGTASALTSCMVPFIWKSPRLADWLGLIGTSILYAVGHGMYILTHSRAEASKLAPFMYFQLLGSIGAGFFFYRQIPSLYMALGGGLITLGGCIALTDRTVRAARRA